MTSNKKMQPTYRKASQFARFGVNKAFFSIVSRLGRGYVIYTARSL